MWVDCLLSLSYIVPFSRNLGNLLHGCTALAQVRDGYLAGLGMKSWRGRYDGIWRHKRYLDLVLQRRLSCILQLHPLQYSTGLSYSARL